MEKLPLYQEPPLAAVEQVESLPVSSGCKRCVLHTKVRNVCMPADGTPGGLLVVGDFPGRYEDNAGRPWVGDSGRYLRALVAKWWQGPVAWDYAVRCHPTGVSDTALEKAVGSCRPYLAGVVREVMPERVLALGGHAVFSLLGRSPPVLSVRRGYGWLTSDVPHVPVYILASPGFAQRNRFFREDFEEDLHWALTSELPTPHWRATTRVLATVEEARYAYDELARADWVATDVESCGVLWEPDFRLLCVAWAARGSDHAYSFDRAALARQDMRDELVRWATTLRLAGQHVKFDVCAMAHDLGFELTRCNVVADTGMWRFMLESGVRNALNVSAELVGMGGLKEEQAEAMRVGALRARAWAAQQTSEQGSLFASDLFCPVEKALEPTVLRGIQQGHPEKSWSYGTVPRDTLLRYNGRDVVSTAQLGDMLQRRMEGEPNLSYAWDTVARDVLVTFGRMEQWGIGNPPGSIERFSRWLDARQRQSLERLAPYNIENPSAPEQVAELLFTRLKLPVQHASEKTNKPSTDDDALEAIKQATGHPIIHELQTWRSLTKMRGTYADGGECDLKVGFRMGRAGMAQWVRSDGRFHPSFKPHGTECMPAGELVLTDLGYLPVEKVVPGRLVITHEGRGRRVVSTSSHPASPIYRVRLSNRLSLSTTGNHEYRTADGGWRRAQDLVLGERLTVMVSAEEWRSVVERPGYEVSSWGRVRAVDGAVMSQVRKSSWGHLKVTLKRGEKCDRTVHRLVLAAFSSLPVGAEVRHRNGIAWDNRLENLVAGTRSENAADAVGHGTMSHRWAGHRQVKLTVEGAEDIRATPRQLVSDKEMATRYGVSRELVRDVRLGKRWIPQAEVQEKRVLFGEAVVVSVELHEPQVTYGLTVEEDASHVTGGIVTHNTGRPSGEQPNCLNIPRASSDDGKMARDCFGPERDGWTLIEFDQSQIELRVMAALSGDKVMVDVFNSGVDFHLRTAQLIAPLVWKMKPEDAGKKERDAGKTTNFALAYGKGDYTLACDIFKTMSPSKQQVTMAASIKEAVLGKFTRLAAWLQEQVSHARRHGYVWIPMMGKPGRRRYIRGIADQDEGKRGHAERQSMNSGVQGAAAEYTLASMIELVRWVLREQLPVKVGLTVYDSLVMEVRDDCVEYVCANVPKIMENWPIGSGVKLHADTKVGPSWGSLQDRK